MKITARVIKGAGARKQLRNNLGQFEEKLGFRIGVLPEDAAKPHQNPDGSHGPLTVGEVAEIHELGLGVPERSFIRAWFDENQQRIKKDLRNAARALARRRNKLSYRQLLEKLAAKYVIEIQENMLSIPPPLARSTIDSKGHSMTLFHTGHLQKSISYEIERLAKK